MYLTAGQYKGVKIEVPKSAKPTLSKVRESIFNILVQYDIGNRFLDMFAGSAIMGLEALSRGYIVKELEINRSTAQIIKKNYLKVGVNPDLSVCDALKFKDGEFDIIYIDPPWNLDYLPILIHARRLLSKNGIIIVEHDKTINYSDFDVIKEKKYGRCCIDFIVSK